MGDLQSLLKDIASAGIDGKQLAFLSAYVRFADRAGWQVAMTAAERHWDVARYGMPDGHMLRLARSVRPTETELSAMRSDIFAFVDENGGEWVSFVVEDLTARPEKHVLVPRQRAGPQVSMGQATATPSAPVEAEGA
jgi:hypothetical protein